MGTSSEVMGEIYHGARSLAHRPTAGQRSGMPPPRLAAVGFALAATLVVAATSCIPVNDVEPLSPDISGTFIDDSARPVVGEMLAITEETWKQPCGKTVYRGTTDSAGLFHLDATTRVQKWIIIIPPVERFGNAYGLCVPPNAGDAPT